MIISLQFTPILRWRILIFHLSSVWSLVTKIKHRSRWNPPGPGLQWMGETGRCFVATQPTSNHLKQPNIWLGPVHPRQREPVVGTSAKLRAVKILASNIFMKRNEIAHLLLHLELCIVLYVLQDGITVWSFFGIFLTLDHFWAVLGAIVKNAKKKLRPVFRSLRCVFPKCAFLGPQLNQLVLVWYLLNSLKALASRGLDNMKYQTLNSCKYWIPAFPHVGKRLGLWPIRGCRITQIWNYRSRYENYLCIADFNVNLGCSAKP